MRSSKLRQVILHPRLGRLLALGRASGRHLLGGGAGEGKDTDEGTEAIKKGDIFNAKGILDSMAKIFLGTDKNNTNIQINSDKEGGVTVNFGFEKNED